MSRNNVNIFNRFLERLKFTRPISMEVQDYILSTRRVVLTTILHEEDDYSPYFGILLFIYFLFRRVGKRISLKASGLLFWIASFALAAGIAASAYAGVMYFTTNDKSLFIDVMQKDEKADASLINEHRKGNGTVERKLKEVEGDLKERAVQEKKFEVNNQDNNKGDRQTKKKDIIVDDVSNIPNF